MVLLFFFFFSSRRRHTRLTCDWSSDVCSSDLRRQHRPERAVIEFDVEIVAVPQAHDALGRARDVAGETEKGAYLIVEEVARRVLADQTDISIEQDRDREIVGRHDPNRVTMIA